jgi:hypothetical protein
MKTLTTEKEKANVFIDVELMNMKNVSFYNLRSLKER